MNKKGFNFSQQYLLNFMDNLEDIETEAQYDENKRIVLADFYYDKEKYDKAIYWYSKAAEFDNSDAYNGLGLCYLQGNGVKKDVNKAKSLFEKAFKKGSYYAECKLISYYYNDHMVELLTNAASKGNFIAEYELGKYYMHDCLSFETCSTINRRNTYKAFEWLMKSAEHEYAPAEYEIGLFYEKGEDPCIRNLEKSYYWLLRAAKQGNSMAMFAIGRLYSNGLDDITPNYEKAFEYFLMAANAGVKEAQYRVGIALKYGKYVKADKKLAYKYLYAAAEQGCADAQFQVALSLLFGIGVDKNEEEAIYWLNTETIDDINGTTAFTKSYIREQLLKEIIEPDSTIVTAVDLADAKMDSYGVLYSADGKRLLRYSLEDNFETHDLGFLRQQTLRDYVVPDSVETICDSAFEGCESIESIKIPPTVQEIGEYAFMNCSNLELIELPEGIKEIRISTFEGCTALTLVLPNTLTTIENDALVGVYHIISKSKEYIVENGCLLSSDRKKIIHYFNDDRKIYHIPYCVETIGPHAFSCCNLTVVIISSNVKIIEDSAFASCENLVRIVFSDDSCLTVIGSRAFAGCAVTNIKFPNGIRSIGCQSFYGCLNLNSVIFPSSLKEIGSNAFSVTLLAAVILPKELKILGEEAFDGTIIRDIKSESPNFIVKNNVIYDKEEKTLLQYYGHDKTFTVPNSVEKIENYAFANAGNLKELIIPSNVNNIGRSFLHNCYIEKIIVHHNLYESVLEATKHHKNISIVIE